MEKVINKKFDVEAQDKVAYISDTALKVLDEYGVMQKKMDEMKIQVDKIKTALYNSMSDNSVKSFETDRYKFSLVAPSDSMRIDEEKMKEEGVYDYYATKKVHRNGYVKYTLKKPKTAIAE